MHINDEQISMNQDEIVSCVTELLDGIDNNELSDLYEFKKYKYKHLVALFLSKNTEDLLFLMHSLSCMNILFRVRILKYMKIFQILYIR